MLVCGRVQLLNIGGAACGGATSVYCAQYGLLSARMMLPWEGFSVSHHSSHRNKRLYLTLCASNDSLELHTPARGLYRSSDASDANSLCG